MKIWKTGFFLLLLFLMFQGCNRRTTASIDEELPDSSRIKIDQFGTDESLDLVTWNIENFPKLGNQTITDVEEIMLDLDADIYAMQEIEDTVSFRELLAGLGNDYGGVYSTDEYSSGDYQKTGVIYKKNLVEISDQQMILTGDSYSFPRPPLQVFVRAQRNNGLFGFYLIVLHLKALGGSDNEARRKSAVQKLKMYLDSEIASSDEKDYIVTGDWNDELSDPDGTNVFSAFLDDPQDYRFLTISLANSPANNATYIGSSFRSVIDHILISADAEQEYNSGRTSVIKIDQFFSSYVNEVSDHRPVGAVFPVFGQ